MPIDFFHVLHVFSLFALVGLTFSVFSAPNPEYRRLYMIGTGVASLAVMLTGFGLLGMLKVGYPVWAIVKLVCWLGVSGMTGQAYRHRDKTKQLAGITFGLLFIALCMVYFKPF